MRAVAWRGDAETGREKREKRDERGEPAPLSRKKKTSDGFLRPRGGKRKRRGELFPPSTSASTPNHLARRPGGDVSEVIEVVKGATREGKREKKAAGLVCIVAPTLTTERWNASSLSTLLNTQKIALTRRSTVPDWKVPLRLPLRNGRWRRVGGKGKGKRGKNSLVSLFEGKKEKEKSERRREQRRQQRKKTQSNLFPSAFPAFVP